MAVYTIYATVTAQDITLSLGDVKVVSGSKDIYQLSLSFSEEWASYTKKVVFETPEPKRSVIEILLDGTNICTIPTRSLSNPTALRIGVYGIGTNNEEFPTVWSERVPIYEGTYKGFDNPAAPDPDVYDEILAAMAGKADDADITDLSLYIDDLRNQIIKNLSIVPYWASGIERLAIAENQAATRIGAERVGGTLLLTGRSANRSESSTNLVRVKITGSLDRQATSSGSNAWQKELTLLANHTYAFFGTIISGSFTKLDGTASSGVYLEVKNTSNAKIFDNLVYSLNQSTFYTPGSDTSIVMAVYVSAGLQMANLKLLTVVQDVTELINGSNAFSYINGNNASALTLNAVRPVLNLGAVQPAETTAEQTEEEATE